MSTMRIFHSGRLAALVLALVLPGAFVPAAASVKLRFDPAGQIVPVGGMGSLAVLADEAVPLRAIELRVEYDAGILTSVNGHPGALFTDSGCPLFLDFDDETPGEWSGVVVILGFDCWITEPGELYRWSFRGEGTGSTRITAAEAILYDPDGAIIDAVSLDFTYVFVSDDGVDVPPPPSAEFGLQVYPNPFNPGTSLRISSPVAGGARLEILDGSGRHVAGIWEGRLGPEPRSFRWEGRDRHGRPLPSGVYFVRLVTERAGERIQRAVLLK